LTVKLDVPIVAIDDSLTDSETQAVAFYMHTVKATEGLKWIIGLANF
jgi:hypothetical protein